MKKIKVKIWGVKEQNVSDMVLMQITILLDNIKQYCGGFDYEIKTKETVN